MTYRELLARSITDRISFPWKCIKTHKKHSMENVFLWCVCSKQCDASSPAVKISCRVFLELSDYLPVCVVVMQHCKY